MHSQSLQEVTMLLSQRLTQIQPVSVNSARSRNFVQFMRHFRKFDQSQLFTYVTLFLVAEAASWHKRLTFNDRVFAPQTKSIHWQRPPQHEHQEDDTWYTRQRSSRLPVSGTLLITNVTQGNEKRHRRANSSPGKGGGVDHLLRQLLAKLVSANINRSHSDCGMTAD